MLRVLPFHPAARRLLSTTSTPLTQVTATAPKPPPIIHVRTVNSVEIFANWSDLVDFSANEIKREQGFALDEYRLVEASTAISDPKRKIKITIPRRCSELTVESQGSIVIAAKDKLEVERNIKLHGKCEVEVFCTMRGNKVDVHAGQSVLSKGALEGVEVSIEANQDIKAKRFGAKQLHAEAGGDVAIDTIYAEGVSILSSNGNIGIGSVHGNIMLRANQGNTEVDSLSGTIKAEASGDIKVHIESSNPKAMNVIVSETQAKVTLSVNCLPVQVDGDVKVEIADPDVTYENREIKLLRPSLSDGAGRIIIRGDNTSSISLFSWIESVMKKVAQKQSTDEAS